MSDDHKEDGGGGEETSRVPPDPMEQVRELLFGATRRSHEQNFQVVDQKIDLMRTDFLSRFAALERRLEELSRETKQDQAQSIETIGSAISQLGESLQTLGRQRKGV